MNETRPLTPRPIWLGKLETAAYARQVTLSQAGRERKLTRFVPTSIPDPDDEIVEYVGLEAWAGEADDSDEEIVPEPMPDDPDDEAWETTLSAVEYDYEKEDEPIHEMWLDTIPDDLDEDENWMPGSMSPFIQFGDGAQSGCWPFVDKHANRRHRKSWMRFPHRHHFHGVTEAELAVEAAFLDGYREAVLHKLAEQGIEGVTVEVIPRSRQRAA